MIPMLAGIGYILSIFGTLYNDLGRLVNLTNQVILFLTPIFYNLDSAPDLLKSLINIIPLTYLIEQFRLVTLYETIPSFKGLAMFVILELIFFYLAFLFFQKYRSGLANIV
jgi:lipopolysaccharide transport system permease protein